MTVLNWELKKSVSRLFGLAERDGELLAMSSSGALLYSKDGGQKWKPVSVPKKPPLLGVTMAQDGSW